MIPLMWAIKRKQQIGNLTDQKQNGGLRQGRRWRKDEKVNQIPGDGKDETWSGEHTILMMVYHKVAHLKLLQRY